MMTPVGADDKNTECFVAFYFLMSQKLIFFSGECICPTHLLQEGLGGFFFSRW
jgi:hypothetical protein